MMMIFLLCNNCVFEQPGEEKINYVNYVVFHGICVQIFLCNCLADSEQFSSDKEKCFWLLIVEMVDESFLGNKLCSFTSSLISWFQVDNDSNTMSVLVSLKFVWVCWSLILSSIVQINKMRLKIKQGFFMTMCKLKIYIVFLIFIPEIWRPDFSKL